MPPKPKADEVVEEDRIVDETVEEETSSASDEPSPEPDAASEAPSTEEPLVEPEPDAATEAAPEPSAAELATQAEIKQLKEENARLKGTPPPAAAPVAGRPSQVRAFVDRHAPAFKQVYIAQGATSAQQFDAIYQMAGQLVGSVMADDVEPIQDNLAARVIQLENELEIRDLRADKTTGAVFGSLESAIRKELKDLAWKERLAPGAIRRIYHRMLGERNGARIVAVPPAAARSADASAALRDVSAGSRSQPGKTPVGFKLSPAQETDFQSMVEDGVAITRERYAARYKARADKARAEKRPVPATLRSFR